MITTVSSGGKSGTAEKMFDASPERKDILSSDISFKIAFLVAAFIDSFESSMPAMRLKKGESMIEKSPLPQYASTRYEG